MITRRALFPLAGGVLGAIPLRRAAPENVSVPVVTRLLFGGDVMLSRYVGKLARQQGDPAFSLRDLAPELSRADLAFVNLESPFSERGPILDSGMVFKAEPAMIAALTAAGIGIVSTANNHARDCGGHGVEFTLEWLSRHGIAAVGTALSKEQAHAGTVVIRNGIRFGFLAYTFDQCNGIHADIDDRVATMDIAQMRSDAAGLLERADVLIVSMHAGQEYSPVANTQQTSFARAAIDAGASIVVGHHPHVTQPWERRGSGVIFYSLGNLVFDQFQRPETQRGFLAEVLFSGKTMTHAGVLAVDIVRTAPRLAVSSVPAASSAARSGA